MRIEVEYEAKTLLSEQDFYKLLRHYPNALEHIEKQTNYYFDTSKRIFKTNHSALRIRKTDNDITLTAKIRVDDHHQEIHLPLTKNELQTILDLKYIELPKKLKDKLKTFAISDDLNQARLITCFTTRRSEVMLGETKLCFDQVTYDNHKDYELEVEAHSLEKAQETLEIILDTYEIPFCPSQPKIARALATESKN